MEVKVKVVVEFDLELPINSFDEIKVDNMTITKSDDLIIHQINEIYDFTKIHRILAVNPVTDAKSI